MVFLKVTEDPVFHSESGIALEPLAHSGNNGILYVPCSKHHLIPITGYHFFHLVIIQAQSVDVITMFRVDTLSRENCGK